MVISPHLSRVFTSTEIRLPGIHNRPIIQRKRHLAVRCATGESPYPSSTALNSEFDAKKFHHNLTRSDKYNRRGFGRTHETLQLMYREYTSDIIKTLKDNGYEYTWGTVTVKLAEAFGFCWGVERAV